MNNYTRLAKKTALTKPVYEPGKSIAQVVREAGLNPDSVLKLASNENPLGPSPRGLEAARAALRSLNLYPDNGAVELREKLARKRGVSPAQIVVGHGSSEIIHLLADTYIHSDTEVVVGQYSFFAYKLAVLANGGRCLEVPARNFHHDLEAIARAVTPKTRLIFLDSPNNPTGTTQTMEEIAGLIAALPEHVIFCFDEAYAEYLDQPPDLRPFIAAGKKVICLRTFSKIYGLAGLRIGYGYCHPDLAALLDRVRFAFNVNRIALAAAAAAVDDDAFVEETRAMNQSGLLQLQNGLRELGLETIPGRGNFILVRIESADKVFTFLQRKGIIVRPLKGYALPGYLRITVGTRAQNQRLLSAMADFLGG